MDNVESYAADVEILRRLEGHGVPIFARRLERAGGKHEATSRERGFPPSWHLLKPGEGGLDQAQRGMAFGLITGHGIDVVDVDPRNGGDTEDVRRKLGAADVSVLAEVRTPGGGVHFYVPSTGLRSFSCGGVDYLGGDAAGEGRHIVFVPPTVRPKYPNGGYAWTRVLTPDLVPPSSMHSLADRVQHVVDSSAPDAEESRTVEGLRPRTQLLFEELGRTARGSRNITLNRILFELELDAQLDESTLTLFEEAATAIGLSKTEFRDVLRQARKTVQGRRERVEDWFARVVADPSIASRRTPVVREVARLMADGFVKHGSPLGMSCRQASESIGVSARTVATHLDALVRLGWLTRLAGSAGSANRYRLGRLDGSNLHSHPEVDCEGLNLLADDIARHEAFTQMSGEVALPRGSAATIAAVQLGYGGIGEIASLTGASKLTVRRHIRVLESAGLVDYSRDRRSAALVNPHVHEGLDAWVRAMAVSGRSEILSRRHRLERDTFRDVGHDAWRAPGSLSPSQQMRIAMRSGSERNRSVSSKMR